MYVQIRKGNIGLVIKNKYTCCTYYTKNDDDDDDYIGLHLLQIQCVTQVQVLLGSKSSVSFL